MLGRMEMEDPVGGAPGFSSLSLGYSLLGNSEVGAGASVSVTLVNVGLCVMCFHKCVCASVMTVNTCASGTVCSGVHVCAAGCEVCAWLGGCADAWPRVHSALLSGCRCAPRSFCTCVRSCLCVCVMLLSGSSL